MEEMVVCFLSFNGGGGAVTSSVKHGRYINEEMSSNEVNIGSQGAYESNASSEEYTYLRLLETNSHL